MCITRQTAGNAPHCNTFHQAVVSGGAVGTPQSGKSSQQFTFSHATNDTPTLWATIAMPPKCNTFHLAVVSGGAVGLHRQFTFNNATKETPSPVQQCPTLQYLSSGSRLGRCTWGSTGKSRQRFIHSITQAHRLHRQERAHSSLHIQQRQERDTKPDTARPQSAIPFICRSSRTVQLGSTGKNRQQFTSISQTKETPSPILQCPQTAIPFIRRSSRVVQWGSIGKEEQTAVYIQ